VGAAKFPRALGGLLKGTRAVLVLAPAIVAAIFFAALLGASGLSAMLALALANVAPLAAATRNAFANYATRGYVEAARLGGASRSAALRLVLPQIIALIAAEALTLLGANVALEAALSYLGLGVQPPAHSLGLLLHDAQSYVAAKPLLTIWPGVLLTLIIIATALAARELRSRALRGGVVGAA
jgi:peptide/nickel transport system permease protein